jgi:hypothetical protein
MPPGTRQKRRPNRCYRNPAAQAASATEVLAVEIVDHAPAFTAHESHRPKAPKPVSRYKYPDKFPPISTVTIPDPLCSLTAAS